MNDSELIAARLKHMRKYIDDYQQAGGDAHLCADVLTTIAYVEQAHAHTLTLMDGGANEANGFLLSWDDGRRRLMLEFEAGESSACWTYTHAAENVLWEGIHFIGRHFSEQARTYLYAICPRPVTLEGYVEQAILKRTA